MNSSISSDIGSISSGKSGNEDEYWKEVMKVCQQNKSMPFGLEFQSRAYTQIEPIDSGTYSFVFRGFDTNLNREVVFKVIKVVSIKTANKLSGLSLDGTELLADVFNEIIITRALSDLHVTTCDYRGHEFQTHNYPKMFSARLVYGSIPLYFMLKPTNDSMNELKRIEPLSDSSFSPREYLVISMSYCGESICRMVKNRRVNAKQLLSICYQLIFALTVAECVYEFEHRDLHIANVLLKETEKPYIHYTIKTVNYKVESYGIKAFIIDTTFSRIKSGDNIHFTSLSNRLNPLLCNKKPDLQQFTYQNMCKKASDDWKQWIPETNIFWLRYFIRTIKSSDIVKKCEDKKPFRVMEEILEQIKKYQKLEDFVSNIKTD